MKVFCAAALLCAATLSAQPYPAAAALDAAITEAVAQNKIPGAVLLIGHEGRVVYRKAYGHRALVPREARAGRLARHASGDMTVLALASGPRSPRRTCAKF